MSLSEENRQTNQSIQVADIHINEQNGNDTYFGGLLNRSDSCCIKCLKIIMAIIFLPFVLLYKILQSFYKCIISFCKNQCYNCLIWLNDKIERIAIFLIDKGVRCLNALFRCCTAICDFLISILSILGRCSKCILNAFYDFTLRVVLKVYIFKAFLQEISSCISVPITVGILVPLFLGFHKYIYHPIKVGIITTIKTIYRMIKYMVVFIYTHIILNFWNYVIVKFLWELVLVKLFWDIIMVKLLYELLLVNFCKIMELFFVKFLWELILVKLFWDIIMVKFLYELLLVNFYKIMKFIFVEIIYNILLTYLWKFIVLLYDYFIKTMNFIWDWIIVKFFWEIICINIWKAIKWISNKLYFFLLLPFLRGSRWIVINVYRYTLKPLYRLIVFILNDILFQRIMVPIYNIIRYILIDILFKTIIKNTVIFIYNIITKILNFFYQSILQPLWNIIKTSLNFINDNLIQPLFTFLTLAYRAILTFGATVWEIVIHCLQLG